MRQPDEQPRQPADDAPAIIEPPAPPEPEQSPIYPQPRRENGQLATDEPGRGRGRGNGA